MTREQQKAASDMAKLGPFTEEEKVIHRRLTIKPEEYGAPLVTERICRDCGAEFRTVPGTKETAEVTALQQFSDHTATHNPNPAQWAAAHKRIEAAKESVKDRI